MNILRVRERHGSNDVYVAIYIRFTYEPRAWRAVGMVAEAVFVVVFIPNKDGEIYYYRYTTFGNKISPKPDQRFNGP